METERPKSLPEPIISISKDKQGHNKLNRDEILAALKKIAPISLYSGAKRLGINYMSLTYAVRDFEKAGLLKTRVKLDQYNRAVRIIYFFEDGGETK